MSIFDGCKSYAGKWQVKSVENIPEEDKKAIKSAHVVSSDYGLSVCFIMKTGNMHFLPVDSTSSCSPGDAVNLDTAQFVVLSRQGDPDCKKIRI